MTWTLRLYDSNDVEIGWVQINPYDYQITHPDGVDAWNHVRFIFKDSENPVIESVGYFSEIPGATFTNQTYEPVDVSGKEHAEWIESEVDQADGVARTAIADE